MAKVSVLVFTLDDSRNALQKILQYIYTFFESILGLDLFSQRSAGSLGLTEDDKRSSSRLQRISGLVHTCKEGGKEAIGRCLHGNTE